MNTPQSLGYKSAQITVNGNKISGLADTKSDGITYLYAKHPNNESMGKTIDNAKAEFINYKQLPNQTVRLTLIPAHRKVCNYREKEINTEKQYTDKLAVVTAFTATGNL